MIMGILNAILKFESKIDKKKKKYKQLPALFVLEAYGIFGIVLRHTIWSGRTIPNYGFKTSAMVMTQLYSETNRADVGGACVTLWNILS